MTTVATVFLASTGASADDPCTWDSSGNPRCTVDIEPGPDPDWFPLPTWDEDDDWPPIDPPDGGGGGDEEMPTTTMGPTTTTIPPREQLQRNLQMLLNRLACVQALTGVRTSDWTAIANALRNVNPGLTAQALRTAMASHELGLAILREIPVDENATLDYPHIDVTEASPRRPSRILIDPRFYQLTSFDFPGPNGTVTVNGEDGRALITLAALAYALGNTDEAAVEAILQQCLTPSG